MSARHIAPDSALGALPAVAEINAGLRESLTPFTDVRDGRVKLHREACVAPIHAMLERKELHDTGLHVVGHGGGLLPYYRSRA
jgi:hypothetical protein